MTKSKLMFTLSLTISLVPAAIWAQTQPAQAPAQGREGPVPYGSGELPPLVTQGEELPRNAVLFSIAEETAYDDNALSNNADRHADVSFGISPRIALKQQRKHAKLSLDYQPTVVLYRRYSAYDTTNQSVQFDAQLAATSRLSLRLRDSGNYTRGIFQPAAGELVTPVLSAPSQLNQSVYTPLLRELENSSRLDLSYRASRRTDITFFGGTEERHFGHNDTTFAGNLFNSNEENAGVEFADRVAKNSTLGLMYMFKDIIFGNASHSFIQTSYATWTQGLVPGISLQVFGGPEFTRIREDLVLSLGILTFTYKNILHRDWHGTYGAVLTAQRRKTAIQVAGRRAVIDGGGLLATVENTDFNADVRRQLTRRWTGVLSADAARSKALELFLGNSTLDSQLVGVGFEHAFTEGFKGRLSYNFVRQRSSGQGVALPDINRNRISLTFFYEVRRTTI